jgi:hypothetical protein
MDATPTNEPATPARRLSLATMLAFLGLAAMTVGWFLPWIARVDVEGVGISDADVRRLDERAKEEGVPDDVTTVVKRVAAHDAVSGRDLSVLGRFWVDREKSLTPREQRGWALGLAVLAWGPWALGASALLLLLGGWRKPSSPVAALVLTAATLVGGFAGLMWIGSSQQAKDAVAHDPQVLGVGIYAIALGGLAAFLGGLFAVRTSTWWKAYLLAALAVGGAVWGAIQYVGPA